jgi:broad specificity phosphatase PhoE
MCLKTYCKIRGSTDGQDKHESIAMKVSKNSNFYYQFTAMHKQSPLLHFASIAATFIFTAISLPSVALEQRVASATAPLTVTDEPYSLTEGLVRELRRGGYVIYLRHGAVQANVKDKLSAGEWWKNCATTQRTSAAALPNAQAIGQALAKQRIAVSDVQTSEFCRAYDTAVFLGVSAPVRNAVLNDISAFASQKRALAELKAGMASMLATIPPPGQNRILVGHALPANTVHPLLSLMPEGHTLIFKPEGIVNGSPRFHFVAALSPGQWQFIGKQVVNDSATQVVIQATQPQGSAQTQAGQIVQSTAPQVVQPPVAPQPPMIDPSREIKGVALVQALRKGGYNLYMRHAQSTIGADQDLLKVPMWWENCMIQRNISDMGREQAKKVGAAMRDLKLPIAEVKASQFCRVRDTATLMDVGKISVTNELNHQIGQAPGMDINVTRFNLLATLPPKGKNVVMVSHTHGSPRVEERIMGGIQEAEVIVYQPDGKGGAEPIARIPPTDWDMLISLAAAPAQPATPKGK